MSIYNTGLASHQPANPDPYRAHARAKKKKITISSSPVLDPGNRWAGLGLYVCMYVYRKDIEIAYVVTYIVSNRWSRSDIVRRDVGIYRYM